MVNSVTDTVDADGWGELLADARQALATLRAEELEDLAARADCMRRATTGEDWIRQRIPRPQAGEAVKLLREQRLLGDLLAATKQNLEVLRRLRGDMRGCAGEGSSRWAR